MSGIKHNENTWRLEMKCDLLEVAELFSIQLSFIFAAVDT